MFFTNKKLCFYTICYVFLHKYLCFDTHTKDGSNTNTHEEIEKNKKNKRKVNQTKKGFPINFLPDSDGSAVLDAAHKTQALDQNTSIFHLTNTF